MYRLSSRLQGRAVESPCVSEGGEGEARLCALLSTEALASASASGGLGLGAYETSFTFEDSLRASSGVGDGGEDEDEQYVKY